MSEKKGKKTERGGGKGRRTGRGKGEIKQAQMRGEKRKVLTPGNPSRNALWTTKHTFQQTICDLRSGKLRITFQNELQPFSRHVAMRAPGKEGGGEGRREGGGEGRREGRGEGRREREREGGRERGREGGGSA